MVDTIQRAREHREGCGGQGGRLILDRLCLSPVGLLGRLPRHGA